ncbi:EAL domain-containing protein [Roseateles sp. BYS180W]|uniref:EAL domain-containing protein n=1 Tax=Roseateles rivi TaxID=3299028 RepID=A0ABW7FUJ1_9BURK
MPPSKLHSVGPSVLTPPVIDKLLHLLLNDAQLGVGLLDNEGRMLFFNHELQHWLDVPAEHVAGMPLSHFFDAEQAQALQQWLQNAGAADQTLSVRRAVSLGPMRWATLRCHTLGLTGASAGWRVLLLDDDTDRKAQEDALRESEFIFRSQFEHGNIGMALTSPDKGWMRANAKLCEMLGYTEAELLATTWDVLTHPDDLDLDLSQFRRLLAGEIDGYELDKRFLRKDGSVVVTHLTVSSYRRVPGPYEYVIASLQDITERKRAEGDLKLAACVFANSQEAILVVDEKRHVMDVNPAFCKMSGLTREDCLGRNMDLLMVAPDQQTLLQQLRSSLQAHGRWQGELDLRHASGRIFPARMSMDAVRHEFGQGHAYACIVSDISLARAHQRELDRIAHYDMLTGVPNRRMLDEQLPLALALARQAGHKLAVCYIDLDGFKPINDRYGHPIGDRVLAEVAQRLQSHVRGHTRGADEGPRHTDLVARLGGDEFVLLLNHLQDADECAHTLQRLLELISYPLHIAGLTLNVSASIGVSLYPDDDVDADSLLRHADQAMYQAKDQGKGRFQLFDVGSGQRSRSRRETLSRIEHALTRGEFCLHYQPKVNMRLGRIDGMEALLRWNHPELGIQLPGTFLPMVEDSDLDVRIGRWVIHQAVQQMARWAQAGQLLPVSINISATHLQSPDFASFLLETVRLHAPVRPEHVVLEIVETTAVADIERVSAILRHCRELGFQFALDDFGTGYSSLTLLRRLPVQELKIDQSFVYDILEDDGDLAITQGIVALAHAFGCKLVAEGVASEAHGQRLLALGCDCAQGMGVAAPLASDAVLAWCHDWRPPSSWRQWTH